MSINIHYEDFGSTKGDLPNSTRAQKSSTEDELLEAFENGYQAGWDDSTNAQSNLNLSVSSKLAANLQDASFQYHEARAQMMTVVKEITHGMLETVLPEIARNSLSAHVSEIVQRHTQEGLEQDLVICVSPESLSHVQRLEISSPVKYEIQADSTLEQNEVLLKLDDSEQKLDVNKMIDSIRQSVSEYFDLQNSEERNDRHS